ncbi:MAG TPA: PEP-CTERM sorting domain-containing protein [Vicinamibacterales bacterium]|nr:PEP-CTERM sorting domain-containing protein [Vicinamibacterales bacterium]
MRKLTGIALIIGAWVFVGMVGTANAAPVNCPGTATTADREFTLNILTEQAPADAVATCFASDEGNLNDDEFAPTWTLVDKDQDPDFAGVCESCLVITGVGTTGGTWTISSAAWVGQTSLLLGFKSGAGQLNPDWAVFQLTGGALTGTWSISGQQSLSHASLFSQGTPVVPEPASLFLLGTGLLGLTRAASKRRKNTETKL